MKRPLSLFLSSLFLLPALVACGGTVTPVTTAPTTTEAPATTEPPVEAPLVIHSIEELNTTEYPLDYLAGEEGFSTIVQNFRSVKTLGSELGSIKAYYPRIKKIDDENYILVFHNTTYGGTVYCSRSADCQNWSKPVRVFTQSTVTVGGVTDNLKYMTPDACVLADGRIACVSSYRAEHAYQTAVGENGVVISYSSDNGKTWSKAETVYVGTNWEPNLLQADNGELLLFFSCTAPSIVEVGFADRSSGVGLVRSKDNGATWTPHVTESPYLPQYAMRLYDATVNGIKHYTDQMPVALQLNNGRIALAAESALKSGAYKFSIAYSDDYFAEDVGLNATGPKNRKTNLFNAAGPYLSQFPSGEVLLTYHWSNTFRYRLANCTATSFSEEKTLYASSGMWGASELISSHIAAVCVPTAGEDFHIQICRVVLNHALHANKMTPTLTGNTAEWDGNTDALFVGAKSQAQAAVRVGYDDSYIYLLAEVQDYYLTSKDKCTLTVADGKGGQYAVTFTLTDDATGSYRASQNDKDSTADLAALGIRTNVRYDGVLDSIDEKDVGYICELAIPRTLVDAPDSVYFRALLVSRDTASQNSVQDDSNPNATLANMKNWSRADLVK